MTRQHTAERIQRSSSLARRERLQAPEMVQKSKATDYPGPRWARTQEAAQADQYISVKLLDEGGNPVGSAFDAKCIFVDGATEANKCTPKVGSGKDIVVTKMNGVWQIIYPTFTRVGTECS